MELTVHVDLLFPGLRPDCRHLLGVGVPDPWFSSQRHCLLVPWRAWAIGVLASKPWGLGINFWFSVTPFPHSLYNLFVRIRYSVCEAKLLLRLGFFRPAPCHLPGLYVSPDISGPQLSLYKRFQDAAWAVQCRSRVQSGPCLG